MFRSWILSGGLLVVFSTTPVLACPECEALAKTAVKGSGTGTNWSDPGTWAGGKLPKAGDVVVIPGKKGVRLDVTPPQLCGLLINGQLSFERKDLSLEAGWILVIGKDALLEVGTESKPFEQQAVITLFGTDRKGRVVGTGLMSPGTKFLCAMDGGRLELHGSRRESVSWTQLAAHAEPGAREITLADAVNWRKGDRICVAPSGYSAREAEEAIVTETSGKAVRIESALKYKHWGATQKVEGRVLDERAEVGLLSRNVVVRGAEDSLKEGFGGHVMVMPGGTAHVEGVEFFRMGQRGLQARYPLHWHLVDRKGDGKAPGKGQYAKNNSVHHSFQRAVVVHGTSGVLVEGNVAFDVYNHCYVPAEDGDEQDNVFRRNLGMLVRKPARQDMAFPHDNRQHPSTQNEQKASVFWMTNPNQTLVGNHAAGSDFGNGFFFDGVGANGRRVLPIKSMKFEGNVAHSNGSGRGNSHFSHYPPGNFHFGVSFERVSNSAHKKGEAQAIIANYIGYKNQAGAVWLESQREMVKDSLFADHYVSAQFGSGGGYFENVVILRQSANKVGDELKAKGRVVYKSVGFYMENGQTKVIGKDMTFIGMEQTTFSKRPLSEEQRLGTWRIIDVANPIYEKK